MIKEIRFLIAKEIQLELRKKYAINGILLYLVSTIFICYLSFSLKSASISVTTWNTLFWIIILFTAVNTVAKSFIQEKEGIWLYYYSLVSPQGLIISKIVYNTLLMVVLSLIGLLFYSLVLGNPVINHQLFIVTVVVASISFSTALTMVSAIAAKAGNNTTLMAILGFPTLVPSLLMTIKITRNALDGLSLATSFNEILTLVAINMIIITVSFLLFPYLWRS